MIDSNVLNKSDAIIGGILLIAIIALFVFVFAAGASYGENKILTQQLDEMKIKEKTRQERANDVNSKVKRASPVAVIISDAAEYYSVPLKVVLGVCHEESRCRQFKNGRLIKSSVPTVVGFMQVKGNVWAKKNGGCPYANKQSDLSRTKVNIWCGVYILAYYKKMYGTWTDALHAYNGGPRAVRAARRGRPWKSTSAYVAKVLRM